MLEFTFLPQNGKSAALVFILRGDWLTLSHQEQLTVPIFNIQRAHSLFQHLKMLWLTKAKVFA